MSKLSRRDFMKASVMATGGLLLASCAPTAQPTPAAKEEAPKEEAPAVEPQTIQYWVFWGSYSNAVDDFMPALLEYIKPHKIDIRTGIDADQVFMTAVAGGTPPDIGTGHRYINYMSKHQIVEIDNYAATSTILKKENFPIPNWDGCFYEGKMYGIPANECFFRRGLNYNTKMLEDAGLDPAAVPDTWEGLLEWHKKLTQFDDAGNLKQIGLDPYDAEASVWSTDGYGQAELFGADWWDPETKRISLDTDEMAESFDMMGEFVKIIGPDNLAGMRGIEGQGTWGGSFNAQVQAMIIEGYWHPGETKQEKPEVSPLNRCTWVPVPQRMKGTKMQFAGGHMVFLYKGAKVDPAITFKVGEFLQTKEHCEPIFKKIGWLPAYKPYLDTVDYSIYPGLDFYFKSIAETTQWNGWKKFPLEGFVEQNIGPIREKHFRGEIKTGKEAAKAFQDMVMKEWKEQGLG